MLAPPQLPKDNFEPTSILVEKQAQMRERGDRRSGGQKSPSGVQGQSPSRESGGRSPPSLGYEVPHKLKLFC